MLGKRLTKRCSGRRKNAAAAERPVVRWLARSEVCIEKQQRPNSTLPHYRHNAPSNCLLLKERKGSISLTVARSLPMLSKRGRLLHAISSVELSARSRQTLAALWTLVDTTSLLAAATSKSGNKPALRT